VTFAALATLATALGLTALATLATARGSFGAATAREKSQTGTGNNN